MDFSAVILAGGRSSRMGRDKAWLEVGGRPLLARQIELVRAAGAQEVFISGRVGVDYSAFGCPVLVDAFADAGPLAGLERGLHAFRASCLFALAVDMPGMNVGGVLRLAAGCDQACGVIPRVAGAVEPLAAFYPKACLPLAETLLIGSAPSVSGGSGPSVRIFAARCVDAGFARYLELGEGDRGLFSNWNSPDDRGKCSPG